MIRACLIPARGQSKRLPRKNVLPLAGRPMLAWPIQAAIRSGLFDRIVVSTEDIEIAEVARAAGADVIERPGDLARDRSTVVEVCLHALDVLEQAGATVTEFCCVYATAAFVTEQDLRSGHEGLARDPAADFVMSVSEYDLPPFQALRQDANGYLVEMWPEYNALQSQDYPHLVCSNGTFYWARTSAFRKSKSFYGPPLRPYLLPRSRALDINTREDYEIALGKVSMLAGKVN